MAILGFRKGEGTIGGDPHLFYYNRQFAYSLRPAREGAPAHDPYAPGLHHLCFRVVDEREAGVEATEPRYCPEYAPAYYATFFEDPDGVRLEVMNFRETRRKVMYDWEARAGA
jgi:glyoxylase I family protein